MQIILPGISPALLTGWLSAFTLSLHDLAVASFATGPSATTLPMAVFSSVRLGVSLEVTALSTSFLPRRRADGADGASATGSVAGLMDTAETLSVRALLLGERLETRGLERDDTLATNPFTLRVGRQGTAFLFRYGVAVFARLSAIEEDEVLRSLRARVHEPLRSKSSELHQLHATGGRSL
jgi:uncharacterized Rmd1/YagE family protein